MSESRDLSLVRNAIAILGSLDRHELVEPISDGAWCRRFFDDPCRAFLLASDETRDVLWRTLQLRLPAHLRETAADQREQERLREFVRPDCPRCGAGVQRVEPTDPRTGVRAHVAYACGCVYAGEDLDAVVRERKLQTAGVSV